MKKTTALFLLSFFTFLFGQKGWSQNKNHVYIFKNNMGFFVKNIEAKTEGETIILKEVPEATFGTLWFFAEGNTIKTITSLNEEVSEKAEVTTLSEQIRANTGKKATVTLQNDAKVSGTVEPAYSDKMLCVKTTSSWYYINIDQVKYIEFLEKPESQVEKKQKKTILKIELAKSKSKQPLQMIYLQKNITWTPNYVIHLLNDKEAQIKLDATLLNDSEDLTDTFVNFVVGVPNFLYNYLKSPLTSRMDISTFLSSIQGHTSTASQRVVVQTFSNADLSSDDDYGSSEAVSETPAENQGTFEKAEDLLFYQIPNVQLKKGERGSYEIINLKTNYTHLYEIDLSTTPQTIGDEKIYLPNHYIALENNSKVAWTTGTVFLNKNANGIPSPVSQDRLNYTPVGGKAKVFLTQNAEIHAKKREKEVSRSSPTKEKDGYVYETVLIEVSVEVRSYKPDDTPVKITHTFTGEPIRCSREWKTTKQVNYYQTYNSSVYAEWDILLKANTQETFTYQYQQKIRR